MAHSLKKYSTFILVLLFLFAATSYQNNGLKIVTVTGEIPASKMGITLPHEKVLIDYASIDSVGINTYQKEAVIARMLPYFDELKPYKVNTFVDGTQEFMGRDPQLLADLSEKTGIHIITNTGWYGADMEKHLPKEIKEMSAEQIAAIWIAEAKDGIGNTGIKPGYIKIAVNYVNMSETDIKLVSAACITHLETGLTIMSFTGLADVIMAQLKILQKYGVDPSALIWAHAMGEPSNKNLVTVAQMGTWIVFDEIQSTLETQVRVNYLLQMMKTMRQLNRILLSHDAGAYQPGKPDGGQIRPYSDLFSSLMLLLLSEGFTREELDQVTVKSPAEAFAVRVRKSK